MSSPRATDLNNDGIKDIVIGSGTDSTFSNYGIVAFEGSNGQILWAMPTNDEIFTSAQFIDLNNDLINFDLNFKVTTNENDEFEALVMTKTDLDKYEDLNDIEIPSKFSIEDLKDALLKKIQF